MEEQIKCTQVYTFWAIAYKGRMTKQELRKKMEIEEIKRQIAFIGEGVLETCKRQRGGFDFLED